MSIPDNPGESTERGEISLFTPDKRGLNLEHPSNKHLGKYRSRFGGRLSKYCMDPTELEELKKTDPEKARDYFPKDCGNCSGGLC